MTKDERLLPLPTELQKFQNDGPATYAPVYDADPFAEKRSIREYFTVVFKRKWLILAIVLIATVSTAVYMYRLPSVYSAETVISIEPRRPKQSKDSINISFGMDGSYRNTQLKLIQSPDLMRNVVTSLGLQRDPDLFKDSGNYGVLSRMSGAFSGKSEDKPKSSLPVLTDESVNVAVSRNQTLPAEESKRADEYARALVGGLGVDPEDKSYLVTLRYTHTNPDLAVRVANAVAKVYIAQDIQFETERYKQASEDNVKTIADLQQTLNGLENDRIEYLKANDLPLQDKSSSMTETRLTTISSQWLAAEDKLRELRANYEQAVRAKASGNPYAIPDLNDSKSVQDARSKNLERKAALQKIIEEYDKQIGDEEAKRAELLATKTEAHPDVMKVDQKIARIKQIRELKSRENSSQIEKDAKKTEKDATDETLGAMLARYKAAEKRENELRAAYYNERAQSNDEGQAVIRLTNLTQQIDTNRRLLNSALERQKSLELDVNTSRPDNVKITTEAQNAGLVGPQRNRNIMIAMIIALASGIGLAFLLDYLDDSVRSSDDVGRHLGLPTLALIPFNETADGNPRGKRLASANGSSSSSLIVLDDARSAVAEAYRHLRTSLLFSSAGKPPQTILITSSQPSEGKTTTAINTAITLAQSGAEVVIVDCDLRRPRLHQHFQLDNVHGLTNYLSGDRNADLLLKADPRLPNLKVITCGPIPPNPAEMLGSSEMRSLIDFLRTNFKHVIIDSPPAISFTDATILATLVDGVVIVAMAGKSSLHLIRRFKLRLQNIGARIYGVVLNGLKKNSLDYGYGYYGYGYYYSYDDEKAQSAEALEEAEK